MLCFTQLGLFFALQSHLKIKMTSYLQKDLKWTSNIAKEIKTTVEADFLRLAVTREVLAPSWSNLI